MKISHRKTDGASDDLLIKANMILDCIRQDILKQKKGNTGYRNLAPDFMLKKDYSSKHHVQERLVQSESGQKKAMKIVWEIEAFLFKRALMLSWAK